ncbi:hypothetical protein ACFTXM_09705 [Streptomyces sp. NPDC056930]|uniref:hypothetical protein n=1 Tax=Streptomyces sp. NPDC056930 TaxID=3345967 RepID=UPI00362A1C9B
MAKVETRTVMLEVGPEEFDLIKRGLKAMADFAEYNDQRERDQLSALRNDLEA